MWIMSRIMSDFVCCIGGYRLCVLYGGYRLYVLYWRIQTLFAVLTETDFVTHSINQLLFTEVIFTLILLNNHSNLTSCLTLF